MEQLDSTTIAIIAAVVVGILTVAAFFILKAFGVKKDTVLLVGLTDSGKTTIFSQLLKKNVDYDHTPMTYSSMQENTIQLEIKGNIRKIVDYPGNDRLRRKLLDSYIRSKSLLKIVFVVDASTFSKLSRDVAELLYDVTLENTSKAPILISCHKQDHSLAKTNNVIRNTLEKEFGFINKSRMASLKETDGSESRRSTLTDTGVDFKWEDLKNQHIDFEMTSSRSDDFGIDSISSFVKN